MTQLSIKSASPLTLLLHYLLITRLSDSAPGLMEVVFIVYIILYMCLYIYYIYMYIYIYIKYIKKNSPQPLSHFIDTAPSGARKTHLTSLILWEINVT